MYNMKINCNFGFGGLLTILFIGLKLTNVITWSWLWVLSPLWISVAIWLVILIGAFALAIWADEYNRKHPW